MRVKTKSMTANSTGDRQPQTTRRRLRKLRRNSQTDMDAMSVAADVCGMVGVCCFAVTVELLLCLEARTTKLYVTPIELMVQRGVAYLGWRVLASARLNRLNRTVLNTHAALA